MGEVIGLRADQLADADCDRLFGHCYWYSGPAAMRASLAGAELWGYRGHGLEGLIGLLHERGQITVYPWTPAVAADSEDAEAAALGLLKVAQAAAQTAGIDLWSVIRDQAGPRSRTQARWLRAAGFEAVSVRVTMARDLAHPPGLPDRPGWIWEAVPDPEAAGTLAQACYAGGPEPMAAGLDAEGWLDRLRRLREGHLGAYLPRLSELLRTEGHPAGFFLATARGPADRFPAGWVYLADIGVAPDKRGQGLGSALLARFLTRCREEGCEAAWLVVDDANGPALALYRALGFRPLEVMATGRWSPTAGVTPARGTTPSGYPPG